ncbi:MAG: hypothetical protein JSS56_24455, partial [Proteobacteria bacterium]|nr:hypothetical protein [Pseudomonadota bacterium]
MLSPDVQSRLLGDIDATALLESRPARIPNWRAESQALERLIDVFINNPDALAQALADTALAMTGAHA